MVEVILILLSNLFTHFLFVGLLVMQIETFDVFRENALMTREKKLQETNTI